MNLLNKVKSSFNDEIEKIATDNIVRKLEKQGLDPKELLSTEFDALVKDEIAILENDTKKVGMGIGIGIAISMLTGI
jgi:tripartite-type tricarboxylate transporter receptor subunit TctC